MSIVYYFPRIEKILHSFKSNDQIQDVNDILELFEITKFVENGAYPQSWSQDELSKVEQFKPVIAKYFKQITILTLPEIYNQVYSGFRESFWEVIDVFDVKGQIDENSIQSSFKESWELSYFLCQEKLVKRHGKLFRKLLISNPHSAEWLLSEYVAEHSGNHKQMYFPKELSESDVHMILESYVDMEDPNINYVRLLEHTKKIHRFNVNPALRLKAKHKAKLLNYKILESNGASKISYAYSVIVKPDAASKSVEYDEDGTKQIVYDVDELTNSSVSGTLRLLRTHFDVLSYLNLLDLVPIESEVEPLERIWGIRSKRSYDSTGQFKLKEITSLLNMEALYSSLSQHGKSLESIISEYNNVYLKEMFGYPSLMLSMPGHDVDWLTKCKLICPEIESVAKQYQLYVEHNEIDADLLSMSDPMKVTAAKSILGVRYYKINSENKDIQILLHLLFSNQTMLTYIEPYKENRYKNFALLMMNVKEVPYDSYPKYIRPSLTALIDFGCIRVDEDGMIRIVDQFDFVLYKMLYDYGVIPSWFLYSDNTGKIESICEKGWVLQSESLFTPKEQGYYSYYLDNERFDDGPAYRNNYIHGNKIRRNENDKDDKYAYYRLLLLLMLLLLRIEDDLMQKQIFDRFSNGQPMKFSDVEPYIDYLEEGRIRRS